MAISIERKREINKDIAEALFNSNGVVFTESGEEVRLTHYATFGIEGHREVVFGFIADRDICVNPLRLIKSTGKLEISSTMITPIHNPDGKIDLITLMKDFEDADGNYVWNLTSIK